IELGKFYVENGRISNRRSDVEIAKRSDKLKNNSKAGKISAKKCNENKVGMATGVQQPFNHTDTDTDITDANASDGVAVDATKQAIWKRGVPFLCERGVDEKSARSVIGKWLRDHGATALFDALSEARKSATGDPVPFITQILKPRPAFDMDAIMADALEINRNR
ncbi:MAG: hypothetical protein IPL79_20215, partial [Myxococcales bacterium]|nr:hypothetical protein [Myxococcales bacterium]